MSAAQEVPDAIAEGVWARRMAGESRGEIAAWLSREGYRVGLVQVDAIAARHAERMETRAAEQQARRSRQRPRDVPPRDASPDRMAGGDHE